MFVGEENASNIKSVQFIGLLFLLGEGEGRGKFILKGKPLYILLFLWSFSFSFFFFFGKGCSHEKRGKILWKHCNWALFLIWKSKKGVFVFQALCWKRKVIIFSLDFPEKWFSKPFSPLIFSFCWLFHWLENSDFCIFFNDFSHISHVKRFTFGQNKISVFMEFFLRNCSLLSFKIQYQ